MSTDFYIEVVPSKFRYSRKRKRRMSWYREEKSHPHVTIGGKGIIGRLFAKARK